MLNEQRKEGGRASTNGPITRYLNSLSRAGDKQVDLNHHGGGGQLELYGEPGRIAHDVSRHVMDKPGKDKTLARLIKKCCVRKKQYNDLGKNSNQIVPYLVVLILVVMMGGLRDNNMILMYAQHIMVINNMEGDRLGK